MRGAGRSKSQFVQRARDVDNRLHDLIAASCGNQFLAQELSRLKILFRAFRDMAWTYEEARSDYRRLVGEAQEHLAIVEALLAGDGRAAALAMSRHIRMGVKYWSRALPVEREDHHHTDRRPTPHLNEKSVSSRNSGK
jgi:DNA-binding GntR family transcriptional regulator